MTALTARTCTDGADPRRQDAGGYVSAPARGTGAEAGGGGGS